MATVLPSGFDRPFTIPPGLEASQPPEARGKGRDDVRLLVTGSSGFTTHARFGQLGDFLCPGDLLVINTSATLPAALEARAADGQRLALHASTQLPGGLVVVEPRGRAVAAGDVLRLAGDETSTLLAAYGRSRRLWVAAFSVPLPGLLRRYGKPISYPYVSGQWPLEAYQNVYADQPGSAEMPSAGRPITRSMLRSLRAKGLRIAPVLLHAGVASVERDEPPYAEYYEVAAETAAAVRSTKARGGRVIAVGTTVVRALESSADLEGRIGAARGWSELVITAQRRLRFVDGLLTGFHEPRSTHVAMLAAVAGIELVNRAYALALEGGYLWHEFGDSHLLLG
ncbi:MAG: S-adenosylmethionine:tRNA ribosyltransferase-isomerase [Candidatus Eremiobacteraeota bacterium]|nr:S-adenosylmethionine:tRNA ribosyltransferase-isomerase [Candidatus Eremiobacteraeota bacterium]